MNKKYIIVSIIIIISGLTFLFFHQSQKPLKKAYSIQNTDQKIGDIENYLDTISPTYIEDVQSLAKEDGLPSWGCGPATFSLAKILDKKFFNNTAPLHSIRTPNTSLEILEKFGLVQGNNLLTDHAWLEIYINDKILYIDPTLGQFGKINHIAYQVFPANDLNISTELRTHYGIIDDINLGELVGTLIQKTPYDKDLYHDFVFLDKDIPYLQDMQEMQNKVDNGIEPVQYSRWVDQLTAKYN